MANRVQVFATKLPLVGRSSLYHLRKFHGTALRMGGGGGAHYTPPLAPFARNAVPGASLTESIDAVWNDGVAPELALDFDMPNVSSWEALMTLGGALGAACVLYNTIGLVLYAFHIENPAAPHSDDIVVPDYTVVSND